MRFFSTVISALVCSAAAAKRLSGKDLNDMLANGEIDQDYLLKHAVPADKDSRRNQNRNRQHRHRRRAEDGDAQQFDYDAYYDMGDNNYDWAENAYDYNYDYDAAADGEEGDYDQDYVNDYSGNNGQYNFKARNPFGGNLSIRFNTCMSFTVEDPDLVENNVLLPYAQEGKLVAQESYVLFDVQNCLPGDCVFNEDNLSNVYMVSLQTFLYSMVYYYPKRREEYCGACQNFYDYCTTGEGIYYDTAVYANGGEYCFQGDHYKMIDCHKCRGYSCYSNRNAYQGQDEIAEWFNKITECQATGSTWHGLDLYAGMMCNSDGTGVEFGIFADDECRLYHTEKSYQKTMQGNDFYYYTKAPEVVEFMFTNSLSCMADTARYITAYQPIYGEDDSCQERDNLNYNCQYLLSDALTRPLSTCQSGNDDEDTDGDFNFNYNSRTWRNKGLPRAQISYENSQDSATLCQVIKQTYRFNDLHRNVYDEDSSGKMFAYDTSMDNDKRQRLTFFGLLGYLAIITTVVSLAVLASVRYYKSKNKKEIIFANKDLPLMT